jgi:hypothetical protein
MKARVSNTSDSKSLITKKEMWEETLRRHDNMTHDFVGKSSDRTDFSENILNTIENEEDEVTFSVSLSNEKRRTQKSKNQSKLQQLMS